MTNLSLQAKVGLAALGLGALAVVWMMTGNREPGSGTGAQPSGGGERSKQIEQRLAELGAQRHAEPREGLTFAGIRQQGYEANSLLAEDSALSCWWALVEVIADCDYSLAAGRYKPTVGQQAPRENPEILIADALELERSIQHGLERLMAEVTDLA